MKRLFPTLASFSLLFVFVATAKAQTSTPTPDGDVVKISTNLIQLDITVTDSKGKPIRDLRADEIEVFENGKKQAITNFSFVSSVKPQAEQPLRDDKNSKIPIPVAPSPLTQPKPENVRRTVAIVVDDLNLSFASAYWVKNALKKYVNEQVQDGDLVAIVRTGGGIGTLQQFTTNKRQLMAAVESSRYNLLGSRGTGAVDTIRPWVNDYENQVDEFRKSVFANASLSSIYQIVRGMKDLPGRKSVVLLSDGFNIFPRPRGGYNGPPRHLVLESMRKLTDLANRFSIVFYTIEAKGLVAHGLTAEDNTYDMPSDAVSALIVDRQEKIWESQEGLTFLANNTGGFAVLNSNNINRGINRILDDQSYYLIGYQPDDETFNAKGNKYNQLEVKVKREGAKVRYRTGFLSAADDNAPRPQISGNQALFNALTSPFATNDIPVRLNALFVSDAKRTLNVQSYLHIDASDLTFTKEPDGTYKTSFDLVGVAFGQNGASADEFAKRYNLTLKESAYQSIQKKGFVYNFAFPIKKHGAYQVRIAIYDPATKKVGSASQFLEIPELKSDRMTLSGLVFETTPLNARGPADSAAANPHLDTSLRRFAPGTLVRYGLSVYGGSNNSSKPVDLSQQVRIFQDEKLIFESQATPIPAAGPGPVTATGSFELGEKIPAGDYIVQVVVTNNLEKGKNRIATQVSQFEVVGR